jgi:hypothetical protein
MQERFNWFTQSGFIDALTKEYFEVMAAVNSDLATQRIVPSRGRRWVSIRTAGSLGD